MLRFPEHSMKRVRVTRRPPVAEHPLQQQIVDALRHEIAPPGKVSHPRDGVVWWSVYHASYAASAPYDLPRSAKHASVSRGR
jgi:hypothetical protein